MGRSSSSASNDPRHRGDRSSRESRPRESWLNRRNRGAAAKDSDLDIGGSAASGPSNQDGGATRSAEPASVRDQQPVAIDSLSGGERLHELPELQDYVKGDVLLTRADGAKMYELLDELGHRQEDVVLLEHVPDEPADNAIHIANVLGELGWTASRQEHYSPELKARVSRLLWVGRLDGRVISLWSKLPGQPLRPHRATYESLQKELALLASMSVPQLETFARNVAELQDFGLMVERNQYLLPNSDGSGVLHDPELGFLFPYVQAGYRGAPTRGVHLLVPFFLLGVFMNQLADNGDDLKHLQTITDNFQKAGLLDRASTWSLKELLALRKR